MPSSRWPEARVRPGRRAALGTAAALLAAPWLPARADQAVRTLLLGGGVVLAMRHALAPGTFDPPGFRVEDCSTNWCVTQASKRPAGTSTASAEALVLRAGGNGGVQLLARATLY
jgi:hypothetical protein